MKPHFFLQIFSYKRYCNSVLCFNINLFICILTYGFPGGSVVKNLPADAGDPSLFPGSGRSAGEGNGDLFQYSGLENSMDCLVHGVEKSWT